MPKGLQGFQKGNQYGKANIGNNYGHANKGRKAPWTKTQKNCEWHRAFWMGKNNPRWNNRISIITGYCFIWMPNHPRARKSGYVKRANLIAELCLKKTVKTNEILHHINKIRADDKPKNLYLFKHQSAHAGYHLLLKYQPNLVKVIKKSNLPTLISPQAKESIENLLKITYNDNSI